MILLVNLINLSIAQPPFQEGGTGGLEIEFQKFEYFQINNSFMVNAHVYNNTGYPLTNETVSCIFHAYNRNGTHAIEASMSFDGEIDFYYNIPAEAFTGGKASWIISCNDSAYGGFSGGPAVVNLSGFEPNLAQILGSIFLLVVVSGLIFVINYKYSKTDFESWGDNIISSHKNMGTTMVKGFTYNIFKDLFLWNWALGWVFIFILKDIVYHVSNPEIYGYFILMFNIYSLSGLLVLLFVMGIFISWCRKIIDIISDNNWGLGK